MTTAPASVAFIVGNAETAMLTPAIYVDNVRFEQDGAGLS